MAVIKCKMCGGDLDLIEGASTAECKFCGSVQTVPKVDDEKKLTLFARANRLRAACEFDKAAGIYEAIVADFQEEAEAYWGLLLCKYGIEYVDDPATGKKIPTCHRSSFDSIMDDSDLEQALENADIMARKVYRDEAKAIEEIRKGIIAVSANEEPYDIFICYKETEENGDRTLDSVLAQDLYDMLTEQGYRVFFARITLEDKLGMEYEPYIFAALNSAKIMLVVGADYEHFNAVWVKNEWGRYLKLMAKDKDKHLIPCYKGIDAYDMPKEFAKLQAQDLGKVGATQDLLRGIKKVLGVDKRPEQESSTDNSTVAPLLKRAFMFLEDGDFERADEFCEQVLNVDPENAQAYLGKLMAQLQVRKQESLKDCPEPFDGNNNYQKALRFADNKLKTALNGYIEHIKTRNEKARLEGIYAQAKATMASATMEMDYLDAAEQFESIGKFKDAENLAKECLEKAECAGKNAIYTGACAILNSVREGNSEFYVINKLNMAAEEFTLLSGWQDADEKLEECKKLITEEKARIEADRLERKRIARRNKKIAAIVLAAAVAVGALVLIFNILFMPGIKYRKAEDLLKEGKTAQAAMAFYALGDYKDAKERSKDLWVQSGVWDTIDACDDHTVGLKADGTVVAIGSNTYSKCNVSDWRRIVAISAGGSHTVGLKAHGTVVAVGSNDKNQCEVSDWEDIVAVSAGTNHTVGLKADGTVVAVGSNINWQCEVSDWEDIVAVSAGTNHTVGLKADGTAVAVGSNDSKQCNVSGWENIIAISTGYYHTVGLKADGTVVAAGSNTYGKCDVSKWTDIVAISAGDNHTVGLKADGTVVVTGHNGSGQCNVSDWEDIVAVSAGNSHTVGLKADGTVVAAGSNTHRQCNVSDWTDIKVPEKVAKKEE